MKVIRGLFIFWAIAFLLFSFGTIGKPYAAKGEYTAKKAQKVYVPKDLDDSFVELKKILKPEDVQKMKEGTESQMIRYHHGLGTWLRNNWGLWHGSRLSKWFNQKGIHHPDDMSGIILDSFWRHLNSKPIALQEQVKLYQAYWSQAAEDEKHEKERTKLAAQKIRKMVMGLSLIPTRPPLIRMADRKGPGLRARYLAGFRGGVLVAVRTGPVKDFNTPGYFLDLNQKRLHSIRIPEIEKMHAAVVAGGVAYFSGAAKKNPILVAVGGKTRSLLPLPEQNSIPVLGSDGTRLLTVFKNSIYRLEGKRWMEIYRGNMHLPKSGPPPIKFGNRIFFRDEGRHESEKRLWWLELTPKPQLISLDKDIQVVGPDGPRWENSFSYCFTPDGDLWITLGGGSKQSLVKRSATGKYEIAIMNNNLRFDGTLLGRKGRDEGLLVSAVSNGRDGSLLAAGNRGLYSIRGKQMKQLLAFDNTVQKIPIHDGKNIYHWSWDPSDILELSKDCYVISGTFGGIYLIARNDSGAYTMTALDEDLGEPINLVR